MPSEGMLAQPQQQETLAMMRLMQLSNQGLPGAPMQLQAPAGQLMPGATAPPGAPPTVQVMGGPAMQASLQAPGAAQTYPQH